MMIKCRKALSPIDLKSVIYCFNAVFPHRHFYIKSHYVVILYLSLIRMTVSAMVGWTVYMVTLTDVLGMKSILRGFSHLSYWKFSSVVDDHISLRPHLWRRFDVLPDSRHSQYTSNCCKRNSYFIATGVATKKYPVRWQKGQVKGQLKSI